ncbi:hypothetical protein [Labrys okinawensis]|uniref:hypothetical protein n=1 Tax=Labrys okinawensis TaxID=346911 RepID=UPI0011B250E5|nr:hypothetical protein [Labrys okinawensis]
MIEIMVSDQVNYKVIDLNIILSNNELTANLGADLAYKLHGHETYIIDLGEDKEFILHLITVLREIFDGKQGLVIGEDYKNVNFLTEPK